MTTLRAVDARPKQFAKRELVRIAKALELTSDERFGLAMRYVRLEDERDELREDLIAMRKERDAYKAIITAGARA